MEYDNAVSVNAMAQAALKQAQLNLLDDGDGPPFPVPPTVLPARRQTISVSDPVALTSIAQGPIRWGAFKVSDAESAKLPGHQLKAKNVSGVELMLANGSVYPKPARSISSPRPSTRYWAPSSFGAEFDNSEATAPRTVCPWVRVMTGMREGVFLVPQSAVAADRTGQSGDDRRRREQGRTAPDPDCRMAGQLYRFWQF